MANVNCENPCWKPVSHLSSPNWGEESGFAHRWTAFSYALHRTRHSFTGCTQAVSGYGLRRSGLRVQSRNRNLLHEEQTQVIKAPAEVCPICQGTGWKTAGKNGSRSPNDRPDNDRPNNDLPNNDRRVTRCDCQLRTRAQSLLAAARIPRRYEHCELSNFEFDGPYRALAQARMAACRFVEEYPIDKTGLLLIGTIGVGKTHLAVGMIKELILGKGIACLFFDYRELLKQIQNSYNDSVKTTELDVLRPVFETEVLVLDELGAVRPTEWVWDTVSLILNTRYNDNRTTIITTNYRNLAERERPASNAGSRSPQLAKYAAEDETLGDRIGNRMRSRLHEMCRIVTMEGTDYRERVKCASFR